MRGVLWVVVGGSGVFCCLRMLGVDGLKFSAQRLKWLNTVKSSYLHMSEHHCEESEDNN